MTDRAARCHHHAVDIRTLAACLVASAGAALALTIASCGGGIATGAAPDASSDGTAPIDSALDRFSGSDSGLAEDSGCGFSCDSGVPEVSLCPSTPPSPGSPCTAFQVCEYGSSWWLECNYVMRCQPTAQGSVWSLEFDGGGCPWLDAGSPCPATWAEASSADAAPTSCPFVTCVYPEGFCGCGIGCGGGGGLPRPQDVTGIFTCIPTVPGCPEPRPLSGTACDDASTYCNYGFACGCGQMEQCANGQWLAQQEPPCP